MEKPYIFTVVIFFSLVLVTTSSYDCSYFPFGKIRFNSDFSMWYGNFSAKNVKYVDHLTLTTKLVVRELQRGLPNEVGQLYVCIGLQSAEIDIEHYSVNIKTKSHIPIGWTEMSYRCLNDQSSSSSCSGITNIYEHIEKLLMHVPFTESFWTGLRDDIFAEDWIEIIQVKIHIGSIHPYFISKLNMSSLSVLSINGNKWPRPNKLLGFVPKLTGLNLARNNIEVLPDDIFDHMKKLEYVNLEGNNLMTLPAGMSIVKELYIANVKNNVYLTMSNEVVSTLGNLRQLHMTNTALKANLSHIFSLPKLVYVSLTKCNLNELQDAVPWPGGRQSMVSKLDLSNNQLNTLFPGILSKFTNVQQLFLGNNLFEDCSFNGTTALSKVERLDMSRNRIASLGHKDFSRMTQISVLVLSRNRLRYLNGSVFQDLDLVMLDLSHNQLTAIDSHVFLHLKRLRKLDLSCNKLEQEPLVSDLYFVYGLNYSHNHLKSVTNVTSIMRGVAELDLSGNRIRELAFSKVHVLNLSYNSMTYIPESMWKYFEGLRVLDLGGNDFSCCHENVTRLRHELHNLKPIMSNLNTKDPLFCYPNTRHSKLIINSLVPNEIICTVPSLLMEVGIPLGVLSIALVMFIYVIHHYQFEFNYIKYFIDIRNQGLAGDEAMSNACVYDAFVCYSGSCCPWVMKYLLPEMERGPERYRFCIHDRDFTLGAPIDHNISAALQKSRKVIFVLSNSFVLSAWGNWELSMANHKMIKENRNYIILIELERLDRKKLPMSLTHLMDSRTYLEWPADENNKQRIKRCWERLRFALGKSIHQRTRKQPADGTVLDL